MRDRDIYAVVWRTSRHAWVSHGNLHLGDRDIVSTQLERIRSATHLAVQPCTPTPWCSSTSALVLLNIYHWINDDRVHFSVDRERL